MDERNPSEIQASDRDASPAEARHVLLVEDEQLIALELEDELRSRGWDVIGPAGTLEEAHELIATGVELDAAVMDVNLAGRWVHSLAEELRNRGVPFIVTTGYEIIDPDGRFEGAPVITKPTSSKDIGTALDSLLESRALPSPGGEVA